jgi:acyl-CoA reductase-like NAD-dependent aldehyde dehydrogenase
MENKNTQILDNSSYVELYFSEVEKKTGILADLIESRYDKLVEILLKYESYEVAEDEISRTLDLLRHIGENEQYFKVRAGSVTSFLPRNQPLYAFTCFIIIPSLMANDVHFRIPHTTKHFFNEVLELLDIDTHFPNLHISTKERIEFLKERTALLENSSNGETKPVTDVVIFTGTFANANKLRLVFDKRTLFISNGSGHNPVVVSDDADLEAAAEAVTTLQFYNQGQDCAAPNAILIHKSVSSDFVNILRNKIKNTKIGSYVDKSSRVGPISDPKDLIRVQQFLIEHLEWIDPSAPGIIHTKNSIVAPTLIVKPLSEGGNFEEMFAPIIFAQEYLEDEDLKNYFEDQRYALNAMYLTLYGSSNYIQGLIGEPVNGHILHDDSTFIHNTHLHAPGVERGTKPYGGYGYGASSISINGKLIAMPTLPQRDIYDWLVKPLLEDSISRADSSEYTQILHKNVRKLLQIKLTDHSTPNSVIVHSENMYVDIQQIKDSAARYVKVNENGLYSLLQHPNTSYIAMLDIKDIKHIQDLLALLELKPTISFEDFQAKLYEIPKENAASKEQNKAVLRLFFQHIYQLLLGKDEGPRLAEFLWSLDDSKINKLLPVIDLHE